MGAPPSGDDESFQEHSVILTTQDERADFQNRDSLRLLPGVDKSK